MRATRAMIKTSFPRTVTTNKQTNKMVFVVARTSEAMSERFNHDDRGEADDAIESMLSRWLMDPSIDMPLSSSIDVMVDDDG
jgi:hypothetical protein